MSDKRLFDSTFINCHAFSRPPGDILFSTVAGAPSHVHAPYDYLLKVDDRNSVNTPGRGSKSISNCLLDPNIDLPSISVFEVDAVLSNLPTSDSRKSKDISSNSNTNSCSTFVSEISSAQRCNFVDDLTSSTGSLTKSISVQKPNLINSNLKPCLDVAKSSGESYVQMVAMHFSASKQPRAINTDSLKCESSQDPVSTTSVRISSETTVTDQSKLQKTIGGCVKSEPGIVYLKSPLRVLPVLSANPCTHADSHGSAISRRKSVAVILSDASKRSPLSVKSGFQSFCLNRGAEQDGSNCRFSGSERFSENITAANKQSTVATASVTSNLLRLSTCSSHDRFKFVCPHPRCGCRFQAEPTLLRHLSKYHGDPVAMVKKEQRKRSDFVRRPASEERRLPTVDEGPIRKINSNLHLLNASEYEFRRDHLSVSDDFKTAATVSAACSYPESTRASPTGAFHNDPGTTPGYGFRLLPAKWLTAVPASDHCGIAKVIPCPVKIVSQVSPATTPFRPTRLRSASGSYDVLLVDNSGTTPTLHANSTRVTSASVLPHRSRMLTTENQSDSSRRRTLSSGSNPIEQRPRWEGLSTCPTCGSGLMGSVEKHREWMSGVRTLAYSKTGVVPCPIDGCTASCHGRADLSAHLASVHFPQVQNQLVRLIFACPVKDCHMVCEDERNFQAHFNRHLFGYLPGDLSELFPSLPNSASRQNTTTVAGTEVHETKLFMSSHGCLKVEDESNQLVDTTSTDTEPALHSSSESYSVPCVSASTESVPLNLNSVESSQPSFVEDASKSQGQQIFETTDESSIKTKNVKRGASTVENPVISSTGDINTVDLADHRSLISALDLIPDDILMELLNEDRSWTDNLGGTFAMHSAPHVWDSPDWISTDSTPCLENEIHSSNNALQPNASSPSIRPTSDVASPGVEISASEDFSPMHQPSSSWVPSPVVQHTWSLAVANEVSSDFPVDESQRECPRHVLSDLTAALILPEVERKLKASAFAKQWTTAATPHSESASLSPSTYLTGERLGRQNWCAGKRRRNASDSSPNPITTDGKLCSSGVDAFYSKQSELSDRRTSPVQEMTNYRRVTSVNGDGSFDITTAPMKPASSPDHTLGETKLYYTNASEAKPSPIITSPSPVQHSPRHPSLIPKKRRSNVLRIGKPVVSSQVMEHGRSSPIVNYSQNSLPRPHLLVHFNNLIDPTLIPP